MAGDKLVNVTDSDADSCSPSKKRRIETNSSDSSSSSVNSSSESLADVHSSVFAGSCTSSASVIEQCQPLSFFLTTVEGIQSKFNQSRTLGIRGKFQKYKLLYILMMLLIQCQYNVVFSLGFILFDR